MAFAGLLGLLSLQVFIGNVFLRPVGTGLSDPPAPPPVMAVDSPTLVAAWQDGLALQSIEFPDTASAGQPIPVRAVWAASRQIDRSYTLFIHLIDAQGQLVAQYDGRPLNGDWPTTCWQPNHSFADNYTMTTSDKLPNGTYRLQLGFYSLPEGERLALSEPVDQTDRSLTLGTIEVR